MWDETKGSDERILFAESLTMPGVVMCYRSKEEKAASPERLNLDRRKMTMCPVLEGEERLRLLNYQHNLITKIDNLHNLPNLIFLDLYNNQITQIKNLESLTTLRVLMLGKNQISRVENMHSLTRLDVLDLHSNNISKIENLSNLGELRVLNLAGNQISTVDHLEGLLFLTELNLRRNQISDVRGVDTLPCLQRLFLSNNSIRSFDTLASLFKAKNLTELALDANPISQDQHYRQIVLDAIKTLRHLDLKRVTEEERRQAWIVARKEEERLADEARKEQQTGERISSIQKAQTEWEYAKKTRQEPENAAVAISSSAVGGAASSHTGVKEASSVGFAEIVGEKESVAHIYGKGLDVLEKNTNLASVVIKFVSFQRIVEGIPRLGGMSQLSSLTVANSDLHSVVQLSHFAVLSQLRCLTIEDNPICTSSLLRPFAIFRMPNLVEFNSLKVSSLEREQAQLLFGPFQELLERHFRRTDSFSAQSWQSLQVKDRVPARLVLLFPRDRGIEIHPRILPGTYVRIWQSHGYDSLPAPLPTPKLSTQKDSAKSLELVSHYVDGLISQSVVSSDKLSTLNQLWEQALADCVRSALADMNGPDDVA